MIENTFDLSILIGIKRSLALNFYHLLFVLYVEHTSIAHTLNNIKSLYTVDLERKTLPQGTKTSLHLPNINPLNHQNEGDI